MSPGTAIDLTANLSETGAPPPTKSQEEGLAAPKEQGEAKDTPVKWGHGQEDSVKASWASWTHWEELQDPLKYTAQEAEAEQGKQGGQADPKDQEKPQEGEQPPGEPTPNLL